MVAKDWSVTREPDSFDGMLAWLPMAAHPAARNPCTAGNQPAGFGDRRGSQAGFTTDPYRCWAACTDVPSNSPILAHGTPAGRAAATASTI